jgi:hypothetical protein
MRNPPVLKTVDGQQVSPELAPLLYAIYGLIQEPVADLLAIRGALRELLQFLSTDHGRINANCSAADAFFLDIDNKWEKTWAELPDTYQDLLGDIGGGLHDTVSSPDIAENFGSTPEQLLDRLEQLSSNPKSA